MSLCVCVVPEQRHYRESPVVRTSSEVTGLHTVLFKTFIYAGKAFLCMSAISFQLVAKCLVQRYLGSNKGMGLGWGGRLLSISETETGPIVCDNSNKNRKILRGH